VPISSEALSRGCSSSDPTAGEEEEEEEEEDAVFSGSLRAVSAMCAAERGAGLNTQWVGPWSWCPFSSVLPPSHDPLSLFVFFFFFLQLIRPQEGL